MREAWPLRAHPADAAGPAARKDAGMSGFSISSDRLLSLIQQWQYTVQELNPLLYYYRDDPTNAGQSTDWLRFAEYFATIRKVTKDLAQAAQERDLRPDGSRPLTILIQNLERATPTQWDAACAVVGDLKIKAQGELAAAAVQLEATAKIEVRTKTGAVIPSPPHPRQYKTVDLCGMLGMGND